ncbi:MAG: hypothetical protein GYB67_18355, partial [Chloroflexi bacterium]|nr:hypothetical protein [Chloroflexota bacterium]
MADYTYDHDGSTETVRLVRLPDGRYTATIGERTYTFNAHTLDHGGWRLIFDEPISDGGSSQFSIYTAAAGDQRFGHVNSATVTLTATTGKRPVGRQR